MLVNHHKQNIWHHIFLVFFTAIVKCYILINPIFVPNMCLKDFEEEE